MWKTKGGNYGLKGSKKAEGKGQNQAKSEEGGGETLLLSQSV